MKPRPIDFTLIARYSIFIFSLLIIATASFGQSYNMSNNSVNTCSGSFYDSGGPTSDYGNNENLTFTICPDGPGHIEVIFSAFDVEASWDELCAYDGTSTAAPVMGCFDGSASPGTIEATSSNSSGCVTFEFTSDGSVSQAGWEATINCTFYCQDVVAEIDSTNPDTVTNGFIEVCPDDTINFYGSASYPGNDSLYHQDNSTSTFIWDFGNGNTDTTQNASFISPQGDVSVVKLTVIDSNGCKSSNSPRRIVKTSPVASFEGSHAVDDTICPGQTNTLVKQVQNDTIYGSCTPPNPDSTYLPDGNGVSYTSSITVDCYNPGQTLNDISNLLNICLNIEHSWLGDLQVEISCPSGQSVVLADTYNGSAGGEHLGEPVDNSTIQGDGYDYCFNTTPTFGTWNAEAGNYSHTYTDNAGNTVTNDYLPAGSYTSENSLSNLVGCTMNGDWEISVTDNLAADDGSLFNWNIEFDPSILPPSYTYTVGIDSSYWNSDPTITSTNGDSITVAPTTNGNHCYTITSVDSFGCSLDTNVCFYVGGNQAIVQPVDTLGCASGSTVDLIGSGSTTLSGSVDYNWSTSTGNIVSGSTDDTAVVDVAGTYTLTVTDPVNGCTDDTTVTVISNCSCYPANPTLTHPTCGNINDGKIVATPFGAAGPWTFEWYQNGTLVQTTNNVQSSGADSLTGLGPGQYTITAIDSTGCSEDTTVTLNPAPNPSVDVSEDTTLCQNDSARIWASGSGGYGEPYTYQWNQGLSTDSAHFVIPSVSPENYIVYAEDSMGCASDTDTVALEKFPSLNLTMGANDTVCKGDSATLSVANLVGGKPPYSYQWTDNNGWTDTLKQVTFLPDTPGYYIVTADDDCGTTPVTDSAQVQFYNVPPVQFTTNDTAGCNPVESQFINTTDSTNILSVEWEFGDGTSSDSLLSTTHRYDETGCYDVSLEIYTTTGCRADTTISNMVCSHDYPLADFSMEPQPTTVMDPEVTFTDLSMNSVSTEWDFLMNQFVTFDDSVYYRYDSTSTESFVTMKFPNEAPGKYQTRLIATNEYGCKDTAIKTVVIDGVYNFYVPSAFTPDGDGINEEFKPKGEGIKEGSYRLQIFNRWGELVYESKDPQEGWDGTLRNGEKAKADIYIWKVVTNDKYSGNTHEYKGHVNLMR